jgi:hypothetical protein
MGAVPLPMGGRVQIKGFNRQIASQLEYLVG